MAVACVLMLALTTTVEVSHFHSPGKTGVHCQICLSLHSAMPSSQPSACIFFSESHSLRTPDVRSLNFQFWMSPLANGPPSSNIA